MTLINLKINLKLARKLCQLQSRWKQWKCTAESMGKTDPVGL